MCRILSLKWFLCSRDHRRRFGTSAGRCFSIFSDGSRTMETLTKPIADLTISALADPKKTFTVVIRSSMVSFDRSANANDQLSSRRE